MSGARFRPRGVIFDLDGTLVDSFEDIALAVNRTREHFGAPPLPLEAVRAAVGNGSEALVRAVVPVPEGRLPEALRVYLKCYDETALQQTRLLPGALRALEHFGTRPLAVVTNKPQQHSRKILQGLGVWERFRIVLGADAVERQKPHPLPIRRVLECFALRAADALLVGDGLQDLQAGLAAGVHTAGLTTGVTPRAALEAAQPEHVVDSLDALIALYD